MGWLHYHRQISVINWQQLVWLSRITVQKHLEQVLSSTGPESIHTIFALHSGQQVTIPCFKFKRMVLSVLHIKDLMKRKIVLMALLEGSFKEEPLCVVPFTQEIFTKQLYRSFVITNKTFHWYWYFLLQNSIWLSWIICTLSCYIHQVFFLELCHYLPDFWRCLGFVLNYIIKKKNQRNQMFYVPKTWAGKFFWNFGST